MHYVHTSCSSTYMHAQSNYAHVLAVQITITSPYLMVLRISEVHDQNLVLA